MKILFALLLIAALLAPAALADSMLVHVDAICYDNNHVGTNFGGTFSIGGIAVTDGSIVDLYPGEYEFYTEIGEYDASPDIGYADDVYTLTANEFVNGCTIDQTVIVTEDKGSYRNYYCEWYVRYTLVPVAGCYVLP